MILERTPGVIQVVQVDGTVGVVPNEIILVTLNKFGREGWEIIQEGPNPNSSGGVMYLLKRRV
jgi:hypothetical protein